MVLNKDELINITGSGFKAGFLVIIGGIITLIIGAIDGYLRPLQCNK